METSKNNPGYGTKLLWSLSATLLLYVLSTGPVVRLALENKIPGDLIETVYAPLVWLCKTRIGEKGVAPALIWYGEKIWGWGLPPK